MMMLCYFLQLEISVSSCTLGACETVKRVTAVAKLLVSFAAVFRGSVA